MANEIIQNAANKVAKKDEMSMQDYIKVMAPAIQKALPSVITPDRFTRMVLSAISTNSTLAKCTPHSFLGAMMTAAQLGVEPNTALGQAYLIPYFNNKTKHYECQFQLGYKGLIDLAYRSGEVSIIQAQTVYENDEFEYELGLNPKLRHIPARENRGAAIAYYAVFKTKDDGYGFEVMSIDDVRKHGSRYSKTFNNGPWKDNFDEMAKKTVLKRVLKHAPLKSDFVRGIVQDETTKNSISDDMCSVPDETDYDFDVDAETGEVKGANTDGT